MAAAKTGPLAVPIANMIAVMISDFCAPQEIPLGCGRGV